MEREPINFEQENKEEHQKFTGPLEEILERKRELLITVPDILRPDLFEEIHKMELAYWNSDEYINSNKSKSDQEIFQRAADRIDLLLEEMKDVHDEDILKVFDYDDGRDSYWENVYTKEFRERMNKLKSAYLRKPGEYTFEDVEMLSEHEAYLGSENVIKWEVYKSDEEVELGYDYHFSQDF